MGSAGASSTGTPALRISSLARILEPIASIDAGGGTDPGQRGVEYGPGELGALRQEAVARVHRVGPGPPRGVEQQVDAQVGVGRSVAGEPYGDVRLAHEGQAGVGVRVHSDGLDP